MAETPSDSPEKPAPEPEKTEAAKPIALTPRQPSSPGERAVPPAPVVPSAMNEQLMSALAQVLTGQGMPAPAPPKDERGLISREEKRFRRGGANLRPDATPEKSEAPREDVGTGTPLETSDVTAPPPKAEAVSARSATMIPVKDATSGPAPIEFLERRQRGGRGEQATMQPRAPTIRTLWRRLPSWQKSGLTGVIGAALLFVGFILGRSTGRPPASAVGRADSAPPRPAVDGTPAVLPPRMAEPAEIAVIDEAMVAQTKRDFPRAEKLLLGLLEKAPDLNGTYTALAVLNLQKGDRASAQYYIKAGIDAGEDAGRLYSYRGMMQAQLGEPRRALESYQQAIRATPHQFKPFLLMARLLRRTGKNQQALDCFDQALARVHELPEDREMLFERRLTLIAMGRGDELAADIQQQLALSPPIGDWLLLAMAVEAQKGDFKAAAGYLERAGKVMNADWMVEHLSDFFFYQWCYEKELEPMFRPLQKQLTTVRKAQPPVGAKDADDPAGSNPPKR